MAEGIVTTMQWQGAGFGGNSAGQVRPDGSFTVNNLAPGNYHIKASRRSQFGEGQEVARVAVTVNGENIDGLRLTAQKLATVRGSILFEGFDQGNTSTIIAGTLRLQALPAMPDESVLIGPSSGTVNNDWSFDLKAPPGPTLIRLGTLMSGWQLKAVRLDGLDVTDGGLDLRSDSELNRLEVILTNGSSQVSGAVFDTKNQPVRDYSLVIFAADREQWHFQSRYLAYIRPDQDGRFKAAGLPPGEYLAIALDYIEPGEQTDPEFLERVRARATRFSLVEGETKTLNLKLQPSS